MFWFTSGEAINSIAPNKRPPPKKIKKNKNKNKNKNTPPNEILRFNVECFIETRKQSMVWMEHGLQISLALLSMENKMAAGALRHARHYG